MHLRWISSAIGIPLFIFLCLAGATVFSAAVFIVAIIGLFEMQKAWKDSGIAPNLPISCIGLVLMLIGYLPDHQELYNRISFLAIFPPDMFICLLAVSLFVIGILGELIKAQRPTMKRVSYK